MVGPPTNLPSEPSKYSIYSQKLHILFTANHKNLEPQIFRRRNTLKSTKQRYSVHPVGANPTSFRYIQARYFCVAQDIYICNLHPDYQDSAAFPLRPFGRCCSTSSPKHLVRSIFTTERQVLHTPSQAAKYVSTSRSLVNVSVSVDIDQLFIPPQHLTPYRPSNETKMR